MNFDILESRQNFKLSLRKKKIDEMITLKRLENIIKTDQKSNEIDIDSLNIDEETKHKEFLTIVDYQEFILELLSRDLTMDYDYVKLGIVLLRKDITAKKYYDNENFLIEVILKLNQIIVKRLEDQNIIVTLF